MNSFNNKFIADYITAALWSTTGHKNDNFEFLDEKYSIDDLDESTLAQIEDDCEQFIKITVGKNTDKFETDHPGHDFWLTRNGHGTGFWNGDYPIHGDYLTKISERFGECNIYVGDDNKLYLI